MKKVDIVNGLLCIALKFTIEILYILIINPHYEYMGLSLDYNLFKNLESYIVMILIYLLLDKRKEKASSIFISIIFILNVIPLLALYGMKNESRSAMYISSGAFLLSTILVKNFPRIKNPAKFVYGIVLVLFVFSIFNNIYTGLYISIVMFILIVLLSKLLNGVSIPNLRNSKTILLIVVGCITVVSYLILVRTNGLPTLSAFNFNFTYEIRKNVVYGPIGAYLIPWQANVINIFFVAIFFIKKDYIKIVIPLFLQLFLFAITSQKAFLFSPFAVIGLFYVLEKFNLMKTIILGLVFTNLMAAFLFFTNISVWLISIVTHRLTFMPAQINYYFFDFFSKNQTLNFSEGFIGKIFGIESPYPNKIFYIIGEIYFNRPDMHTNTWFIADAYSNGGVFGVFTIALIFSLVLIIIDSITKNYKVTVAALFMPILSLTNISLLTSFFTNGLMIGIIIIAIYSKIINTDKIASVINNKFKLNRKNK